MIQKFTQTHWTKSIWECMICANSLEWCDRWCVIFRKRVWLYFWLSLWANGRRRLRWGDERQDEFPCLVSFQGKVDCVAGGSGQMKLHGQEWCVPELAGFGCFGGCVFRFSLLSGFLLLWFGISVIGAELLLLIQKKKGRVLTLHF